LNCITRFRKVNACTAAGPTTTTLTSPDQLEAAVRMRMGAGEAEDEPAAGA
jgi:hypothetical protein